MDIKVTHKQPGKIIRVSERGRKLDEINRRTMALLDRNRAEISAMTHGEITEPDDSEEEIDDDPQAEIDAIRADKTHPLNDPKASAEEHQAAVDYMNELIGRTLSRRNK